MLEIREKSTLDRSKIKLFSGTYPKQIAWLIRKKRHRQLDPRLEEADNEINYAIDKVEDSRRYAQRKLTATATRQLTNRRKEKGKSKNMARAKKETPTSALSNVAAEREGVPMLPPPTFSSSDHLITRTVSSLS